MFGKGYGPYRVWMKKEQAPGLAMSRSLGDEVAQSCGVSPKPEVLQFKIESDHKAIILGSDGIFEFISDQEALNLIEDDIT